VARETLSALKRRRLVEKLRLLCSCGAGLEAIAAPASEIARDLIAAASGSIFWRDEAGNPAGFYHDCAPVELKDYFVTNLDELFSRPDEFNMVSLTDGTGEPIGTMLGDARVKHFLTSNVFKYLCEPLGHYHCLDVRIDNDTRGIAVLALWNEKDRPFTARDAAAMEMVREQLNLAVRTRRAEVQWRSQSSRGAHLIADRSGAGLMSIDDEAEKLLMSGHLLNQGIPMAGELPAAPSFCRQLAASLDHEPTARLHIPIANGRLECTASLTRIRNGNAEGHAHMFVAVDHQTALDVDAVEYISALPLTFLQKQVALFAMEGGQRPDCEDRFAVSSEALKKHLRTVYDVTGADNWGALRDLFWR
jgi:hypothetical protein